LALPGRIVVARRSRSVAFALPVPGLTAIGKPRMSAAGVGGPALMLEAGFFVEPYDREGNRTERRTRLQLGRSA